VPSSRPSTPPPVPMSETQIPALKPGPAAPVAVPDDHHQPEPGDDRGSA
jgi:hypothetical protein